MKKAKNKFKKKSLLEVAHEAATGLYEANIINAKTMREFDSLCLPPVRLLSPQEIKKIRLREKVSQAVFAKYLNTSPSTVKQWEQGEKQPRGTSLKLLNLVENKGLRVLVGIKEEIVIQYSVASPEKSMFYGKNDTPNYNLIFPQCLHGSFTGSLH